jgi:hypothetical protein
VPDVGLLGVAGVDGREELIAALEATAGWDYSRPLKTGVLQT